MIPYIFISKIFFISKICRFLLKFPFLRWLLGLRKLRSSKKAEILQVVLVLRVASFFIMGKRNGVFFPYFRYEIIFYWVELFECPFNFKFCQNVFIFLNNEAGFEIYKKQPLQVQPQRGILEVNCQASNFTLRAFLRILVAFFRPVLNNLLRF